MEVNLLGGNMGTLDFSGVQGLAQSVAGVGATISNIGAQERAKRDQAAEYRFAAESQKRNIELQGFIQNQATEFNAQWSSPDFDREGAADRMSSEIQEYYEENIRGAFDENQAARFEANVLYPTLGNQKNNVNNVIAGFDLQAGKDANWSVINSVPSLISSGAKPIEALETGLDALESLYQAGEFRSKAAYQEQADNLKANANSSYLNIALDELLDKGIEAQDVEGIVDAINQKDASLAGDFESDVKNMLSNLNTDTENNLFEFAKSEEMKSVLKSNILNKEINKDNTYKAEVSKINLNLDTLQKEDNLTVAAVAKAFEGRTDRFSNNSLATWNNVAEIEDDNRLTTSLASMTLDIKSGDMTIEELENSPKWDLYANEQVRDAFKEDLIGQAKLDHDNAIALSIGKKYQQVSTVSDILPEGADEAFEFTQNLQDSLINKGVVSEEDKKILDSMYNQDFATEVALAANTGVATNLIARINLEHEQWQEENFGDLQELVFLINPSEEKTLKAISDAYLNEEITAEQKKLLESDVSRYGRSTQIKDAKKSISDKALEYAGGETGTAYNHYYATMWNSFSQALDNTPDQDSPDFVQKVLDSYLSEDNRLEVLANLQYGTADEKKWVATTEGNGNKSDFNSFLWTVNDSAHFNPSQRFPVGYNLAKVESMNKLVGKFGNIPFTLFEDNRGPLYTTNASDLPDDFKELFSKYYPDADPSKTTVAFQYGVVGDPKDQMVALYAGVVDGNGAPTWHNYTDELIKPTQGETLPSVEVDPEEVAIEDVIPVEAKPTDRFSNETIEVPVKIEDEVAKTLYDTYGSEKILAIENMIPNVVGMRVYSNFNLRLALNGLADGVSNEDLKTLWDQLRGN